MVETRASKSTKDTDTDMNPTRNTDVISHDSLREFCPDKADGNSEVTLEILFQQLQTLSKKIHSVEDNIIVKLRIENAALKNDLNDMKKDLEDKDKAAWTN